MNIENQVREAIVAELKRRLDSTTAVDAVVALMLNAETQRVLGGLRPEWKEQVREYAKARMVAFGWTPSRAA